MALTDHPNVFSFEGRLWVSELPRDDARAQLANQRAWDAANLRYERWGLAIVLGAVAGVLVTLGLGTLAGQPPAVNFFVLPIGFAVGAVLGAVINKRVRARALENSPLPPRPVIAAIVRVPPEVAKRASDDATAAQLIAWSHQGYVGGSG